MVGCVVPWFHRSCAAWKRKAKGLLHLKCGARQQRRINQTDRQGASLGKLALDA